MKKLYLFGDSFSMVETSLQEDFQKYLEVNAHYSISNDHILKLVKLKLLKLIDEKKRDCNILIQLTIPNRMMVIFNPNMVHHLSNPENLKYSYKHIPLSDLDIFEQGMYSTLYPFTGGQNDKLVDNLFIPYATFVLHNNIKNLLKDWVMELKILFNLAIQNGINLEYFFFTNDYDGVLKKNELDSFHIKFDDEFNSLESYVRANYLGEYFVSKLDKHFNNLGHIWYMDFLRKRYDF